MKREVEQSDEEAFMKVQGKIQQVLKSRLVFVLDTGNVLSVPSSSVL